MTDYIFLKAQSVTHDKLKIIHDLFICRTFIKTFVDTKKKQELQKFPRCETRFR